VVVFMMRTFTVVFEAGILRSGGDWAIFGEGEEKEVRGKIYREKRGND
jgi:hypothetical protein